MSHFNVLIPIYNEEECIESTVDDVIQVVSRLTQDFTVLLYNDGSTDQTLRIIEKISIKHPQVKVFSSSENLNIGAAFRYALKNLSGDLFTWLPADGEISAKLMEDLYRSWRPGELVYSYPVGSLQKRGWARTILSELYQRLFRFSFGSKLRYFNGPALYPLEVVKEFDLLSSGFTVNAELLLKASRAGLREKEVSYNLRERQGGEAKALNPKRVLQVFKSYFHLLKCLKG